MNEDPARAAPLRWPRFVLIGVILFFVVSSLWLMVFVQRVHRIKTSTQQMTNSSHKPTP